MEFNITVVSVKYKLCHQFTMNDLVLKRGKQGVRVL